MRGNPLMYYLWYDDIPPEVLASTLEISPDALFQKIFGDEEFTAEEIGKIVALVGLTEEETNTIFG